jgi:hypothetical protein
MVFTCRGWWWLDGWWWWLSDVMRSNKGEITHHRGRFDVFFDQSFRITYHHQSNRSHNILDSTSTYHHSSIIITITYILTPCITTHQHTSKTPTITHHKGRFEVFSNKSFRITYHHQSNRSHNILDSTSNTHPSIIIILQICSIITHQICVKSSKYRSISLKYRSNITNSWSQINYNNQFPSYSLTSTH